MWRPLQQTSATLGIATPADIKNHTHTRSRYRETIATPNMML